MLLLPSEVQTKLNETIDIVKTGIEQTISSGQKKHGLIIGRDRKSGKAIDIILTDTDPPQIAYLFGAW